MSITEVCGDFRTGKTQLSDTLYVTLHNPNEMGGEAGKVAIIYTDNTIRPWKHQIYRREV